MNECVEANMGALIFVCPTSGHEVSTGLEIDPDSYRALPKVLAEVKCPACGLIHNLYEVDTRLADESSDGTQRTNPEAIGQPRSYQARHKKAGEPSAGGYAGARQARSVQRGDLG